MTIEKALEGAERIKKRLKITDKHNIRQKDITDATNVIEGLIRIIYWYDANQLRLVKSLNRLVKKEKAIKRVLAAFLEEGSSNDTA